ncbi:acid protease [Dentipellis sp. KUC8613]|nr:acid protease [Dentipellis sp. KUC8613]
MDVHSVFQNGRNSIGERSSTSFRKTADPFSSKYEDDSTLTGFVATDDVKVGGKTLPTFRLGIANTLQGKVAEQEIDGIMGFAKSTASHVGGPTVLEALAAAQIIPAALSGWSITRHADGDTGEVLLGALNTQLFDDSKKLTLQNVRTAQSGDGLFRMTIASMQVGGTAVAGIAGRAGAVDVGTSAIFVPQADLLAIRAHFPGAVPVEEGAAFAISCDNQVGITLTIGGTPWTIEPQDLVAIPMTEAGANMCLCAIAGDEDATEWVVGTPFFKNVYHGLDVTNDAVIIAPLAVGVAV